MSSFVLFIRDESYIPITTYSWPLTLNRKVGLSEIKVALQKNFT